MDSKLKNQIWEKLKKLKKEKEKEDNIIEKSYLNGQIFALCEVMLMEDK